MIIKVFMICLWIHHFKSTKTEFVLAIYIVHIIYWFKWFRLLICYNVYLCVYGTHAYVCTCYFPWLVPNELTKSKLFLIKIKQWFKSFFLWFAWLSDSKVRVAWILGTRCSMSPAFWQRWWLWPGVSPTVLTTPPQLITEGGLLLD